jgi:hypothetical protein
MALTGAMPKEDRTQVRHRNPVADWDEYPDVPFDLAPPLRPRVTASSSVLDAGAFNASPTWPDATLGWWRAVSQMPHAKMWTATDWQFAMDTAEVHARTMEAWKGYGGTELRQREQQMGTTFEARRKLRIRYVKPKAQTETVLPAGVTDINSYRDL